MNRRPLMTKHEAAKYLKRHPSALDQDRRGLQSIPFIDLSLPGAQRKTIRYDPIDLDIYIEARRTGPPRVVELLPPPPVKRGRGRPKGSRNKRKWP